MIEFKDVISMFSKGFEYQNVSEISRIRLKTVKNNEGVIKLHQILRKLKGR